MPDVISWFEEFFPRFQGDRVADLQMPLLMYLTGSFLSLRIETKADRYTVGITEDLFEDANESQEHYFKIFEKYDTHHHYCMQCREGRIERDFSLDFNLNVAMDETLRFFAVFDDFFLENNVIGHEEDWKL